MSLTVIPGVRAGAGTAATDTGLAAGGGVQGAIASAASATGVDFHYLYHQAKIESGLNPNAKAATSSASGLYQFTSQTWLAMLKQHGAEHGLGWAANAIERTSGGHYVVSDQATKAQILALRQDAGTSAAMAGEYASDNRDFLEKRLGRDAGSVDLYMAHFLGPAGASRFLAARDADGSQSAAALLPAAAHANRWVFYNKDGSARSLDEVYQRFASRFGGQAPAASGDAPAGASTVQTLLARQGTSGDTASELARMQLAALNGGDLPGAATGGTAAATGDTLDAALDAKAALTPSPQTAKLAYLMLSSLGM